MSIFNIVPQFKSEADVKRFTTKLYGVKSPLSHPTKMPEEAFNIPADECKAGSHMVDLEDFICHDCYALPDVDENGKFLSQRGGRYKFAPTQQALYNRLDFAMGEYFVHTMSWLINFKKIKYFRWFDSGDIQSQEMLSNICEVCRNTPNTKHWLPTKEWKMVEKYLYAGNKRPDNLVIRLSGLKKNGSPPTKLAKRLGLVTSTVVTSDVYDKISFKCPSSKQNNKCLDCRACWTQEVDNVPYKWH